MTPPRAPLPPARRVPGLDGIRALAVTAVVVYHLFPGVLVGGFIGVDMFFVLSGFLITGLLVREWEGTGRINLPAFWRRRVRRLVPALVAMLLVVSTAALIIGGDVLVGIGRQLVGAVTFSYNWVELAAANSYFTADAPGVFRNLWSLAIEEQFYLLWPVLMVMVLVAVKRPAVRVTGIAVLAAASAVWMIVAFDPAADPTRVYFGTDTHSFGLLVGALLALTMRWWVPAAASEIRGTDRTPMIVGIGALAGLATLAVMLADVAPAAYQGGLLAVSLLTAALIWSVSSPGSGLGRLLDVRGLQFLGRRSYGLYLWHWPVWVLVSAVMPTGWTLTCGLLALGLAWVATMASYRYVEEPIRLHGLRGLVRAAGDHARVNRVQRQRVGAVVVTIGVVMAATAAAVLVAPSMTSAERQIQRGIDSLAQTPPPPTGEPVRTGPKPPLIAAPEGGPPLPAGEEITAIGDSVMLASAPELQAAFPGIWVDAAVSRQLSDALPIIQSMMTDGTLRENVVLGLGTNGPISPETVDSLLTLVGSDHRVVLVNAQAPREWIAGVNATLAERAGAYRFVEVANWHDAIAPHIDILADDEIHPGPTGGRIYTHSVQDALQTLVDLGPEPRLHDYIVKAH